MVVIFCPLVRKKKKNPDTWNYTKYICIDVNYDFQFYDDFTSKINFNVQGKRFHYRKWITNKKWNKRFKITEDSFKDEMIPTTILGRWRALVCHAWKERKYELRLLNFTAKTLLTIHYFTSYKDYFQGKYIHTRIQMSRINGIQETPTICTCINRIRKRQL